MRFDLSRPGPGLVAAALGAMLILAGQLPAQQAGRTGYAQGRGVMPVAMSGNSSVFPGGSPMTDAEMESATTFTVRIENISKGNALRSSSGGEAPFAIAPGMWVIHKGSNPLFEPSKNDAGKGLEPLAEDGNPALLAEAETKDSDVMMGGVYNTPVGASAAGAAEPGQAFEFTIMAPPGARLSFAEMFGQSNDLFYGPGKAGIALFGEDGKPARGDVTSRVVLWDAGTEVNQEPGFGPDQAPRQKSPNTGAAEKKSVGSVRDSFTYPATDQVLRVTITPAS